MNPEKHKILDGRAKEHSRMLFFVISVSFLVGTIFGSGTWGDISIIYLLVLDLIFVFLVRRYRPYIFLMILIASLCGHMIARDALDNRYTDIMRIEEYTHGYIDKLRVTGILEKELYRDDTSISYRLLIDNFDNISTNEQYDVEEKIYILIQMPKNLRFDIGDKVSLEGKILDPKVKLTGFGKYLILQNIAGKIYGGGYNYVEKLSPPKQGVAIGKSIESAFFQGFPRDNAGILLGMTIGNTRLMNQYIKDDFQNSGLTHILVVSGSNITFLILMIVGMLRYIPIKRVYRMSIVISSILLYGSLVGWEIPVIRATVMGILAYIGLEHASRFSSMAILLLIAIILVIIEPLSLIYDAGFGLSFGATMSIILYGKRITVYLEDHGFPSIIAGIFSVTIAASIGTLPVMLYHFESISVGFLLANILIGGVVGILLFLSVGYILLSSFGNTLLLYWYGYLLYFPTEYILRIAKYIGNWGVLELSKNSIYIIISIFMAHFLYELLSLSSIEKNQKERLLKNLEHR